jgi:hypothetical protein
LYEIERPGDCRDEKSSFIEERLDAELEHAEERGRKHPVLSDLWATDHSQLWIRRWGPYTALYEDHGTFLVIFAEVHNRLVGRFANLTEGPIRKLQ